jgi:CBS domain containing-hemolysin-like protein
MFPMIWTLNAALRLPLRMLGLRRISDVEMLHSKEVWRLILQCVELEPDMWRAIDHLIDFPHWVAQHVMTLGRNVVVLDAGRSWDPNLSVAIARQYTRHPSSRARDRVLGYVDLKDIVTGLSSHRWS